VPDEGAESESPTAERLTVFSDAVVAIAITLLALDLPVPDGNTLSALLTSARHNDGHYGAFLISFGTIAAAQSPRRGATITMSSGTPGVSTRGCGRSTWSGC
jgi:hypothetical protein